MSELVKVPFKDEGGDEIVVLFKKLPERESGGMDYEIMSITCGSVNLAAYYLVRSELPLSVGSIINAHDVAQAQRDYISYSNQPEFLDEIKADICKYAGMICKDSGFTVDVITVGDVVVCIICFLINSTTFVGYLGEESVIYNEKDYDIQVGKELPKALQSRARSQALNIKFKGN